MVSKRLKISSNFFLGPVASSFLFLTPGAKGTPSAGAQNIRGWEIFAILN